jgi:quercetin dioxygenase-like cupin family protein
VGADPLHVHPDRVEAFWVLDEAEFELDGQLTQAGAGSFVLVPGGVGHPFGATATSAARLLVLHAPNSVQGLSARVSP